MEKVSQTRTLIGGLFLVVVLFVGAVIWGGGYRFYMVPSESMEPTLNIGDRIVVDANAIIEKWDIIALKDPKAPDDTPLVKRVIATGGQDVVVRNGVVYVDDEVQYNPYIKGNRINWKNVRIEVPHGTVFVLGDNRNESYDSLDFGPVKLDLILGRVTHIYWPISNWGNLTKFTAHENGTPQEN